ncbi:MAG: aminoglycoside/choline kinase family phosphotransferase [Oleiphilaceae bacterium]|jgi:aminoglycoside/choline kinase family phosphotransferase
MDSRYHDLCQWVAKQLNQDRVELSVVSGDASFRRYFRFTQGNESWIVMDAPPEKEDSSSFVSIANNWLEHGIQVPEIKALNLEKGFMLLSDFGEKLLLSSLNPKRPNEQKGEHYYFKAMHALAQVQALDSKQIDLPRYDSELLQREMALFKDWLIEAKLGLSLSKEESQGLIDCLSLLEERALAQQQVTVHRDFHARNLMICDDDSLGLIDFQDAVLGPITYDLVSLLRDCYIVWPNNLVKQWSKSFYDLLLEKKPDAVNKLGDFKRFKEDFDLMGLQRHLKVAGIFARLSLRDAKHSYLADIPRTLEYILSVSKELISDSPKDFSALTSLVTLIENRVLPLTKHAVFLQE